MIELEKFCRLIINSTSENMQVKIHRCISWERFYQKYSDYHKELLEIVNRNKTLFEKFNISDLIVCLFLVSRIIYLRIKGYYNISLQEIFDETNKYDIELKNRLY